MENGDCKSWDFIGKWNEGGSDMYEGVGMRRWTLVEVAVFVCTSVVVCAWVIVLINKSWTVVNNDA